MKGIPEERAIMLGNYIVDHETTVRQAAKVVPLSKSTIHKDVSFRLLQINPNLQAQVQKVLDKNKQERHIRGGMATKNKYTQLRTQAKK